MTDEDGPVRTQGWSRRLDDDWQPPEQPLNYAPPQVSTPSTQDVQRPRLNDQLPTNASEKSKRTWIWAAAGVVVLLVLGVLVGVLFTGGSSSKPTTASSKPTTASSSRSVPPTTANTVNPLQTVASQYEQYFNPYATALQNQDASIAAANADITQQTNRIAADQTTYPEQRVGNRMQSRLTTQTTLSCVSQEQQTAADAPVRRKLPP